MDRELGTVFFGFCSRAEVAPGFECFDQLLQVGARDVAQRGLGQLCMVGFAGFRS